MKFLALIYNDESHLRGRDAGGDRRDFQAHGEFSQAAGAAGVLVGGEGLQPTATATTVRVRDGERMLTDGPYAETKEQLGGYYAARVQGPRRGARAGPRGSPRPRRARSRSAR